MGVSDHKAIKQETRSQLSQRPAPGTHRPGGLQAGGSGWCPGPVKKESLTQQCDTLDDEVRSNVSVPVPVLPMVVCLFVGCLTSQQHVSVSQGQICSDSCAFCHIEIEVG